MQTLIVRKPNRPENDRLKRQGLEYKRFIRELKKGVTELLGKCTQRDAYYKKLDFKEEVI